MTTLDDLVSKNTAALCEAMVSSPEAEEQVLQVLASRPRSAVSFIRELSAARTSGALTAEVWAEALALTPVDEATFRTDVAGLLQRVHDAVGFPRLAPVAPPFVRGAAKAIESAGSSVPAVLAHLRSCPVVLAARTRLPDRVDPSAPPIPLAFRSDGTWVWSAELEAYLERHDLALPDAFVEHLAVSVSQPVELDERQREAAAGRVELGDLVP